jgi:hypothetical protein
MLKLPHVFAHANADRYWATWVASQSANIAVVALSLHACMSTAQSLGRCQGQEGVQVVAAINI